MSQSGYHFDLDPSVVNRTVVGTSTLVVDDAGLLLMLRRRDARALDTYHLPGGPQFAGESASGAASRAAVECTGVAVEIIGLVGVYSEPQTRAQELAVCFRGRPVSGDLRTGDPDQEPVWVEPERLDELNVPPATRLCIAHGLTKHGEPYFT
ncbi:NUDIX hydrolase [Actinokineospora sp.]|uniref:NUDIX hydrolase n=1 Tax=Actinokineospora sp. TaxID=1872133 RepID=UPI004037BE3D